MASTIAPETNLSRLQQAAQRLDLGLQDIADIVGVDQSTLYRWRHGAAIPRAIARARLAQVEELFAMLPRLFAGPDVARTWLHQARPESLGGEQTPLDVLRSGRIDRVMVLLNSLAAGG